MIFNSKYPDIKIPQVGIYQYVTSNPNKISEDKVIYLDGITGKSYTFGEFKHESKKFAAGLQDKLEFKHSDVLAIFSPNQVDYPIVLFGAIAAGGKVATIDTNNKATELSYQSTDSSASVLIVHPELLEIAIEASIDSKILTSKILLFGDQEIKGYKPYRSILIGDRVRPIKFILRGGRGVEGIVKKYYVLSVITLIEPIYYTPEEAKSTTAYLLYSSGTIGTQKCIERTHTNAGATTIIHSSFSVETFCESIQKYKINLIYAAPEIILKLVNDPLAQQFNLSSVDTILSAVAPLGDKLGEEFYEMFKMPILQTYGLTETGVVLRPQSDTIKNAAPAKMLSEDGRELGYNEPGELWVHGPNIMKGYLNNKEVTDAVIDKDGFFNTGEIAYIDEQGNYLLVIEKKDLINYKDFQVVPSELESILLTHDAISDAAVIGYYSEEEATEIPIAYVTIKNEHEQTQDLAKKIQSFVDEKVATHKKLRGGVLFIDRIPKNEAGKILKKLLREKLKNDINE
ncbi:hypothetical protein C2G38_2162605 [Gigaspora rosea]|uniref:Uncharacterized protein n=1 Tax=Gigaspora rosea TaxID=44941 RepID=A0A397VXR2_9GLOM|nr:hypothetical protein C2G38_2162605 [Gigaspora rosea]